jgi:hypothetical protein
MRHVTDRTKHEDIQKKLSSRQKFPCKNSFEFNLYREVRYCSNSVAADNAGPAMGSSNRTSMGPSPK